MPVTILCKIALAGTAEPLPNAFTRKPVLLATVPLLKMLAGKTGRSVGFVVGRTD